MTLQVRELAASRGFTQLFHDLEFSIEPGGALWLRGANGAGKTTLLRVLCGLTQPDAGTIAWHGQLRRQGLRELAAYCGHHTGLTPDLTVEQNLEFLAQLHGWRPGWLELADSLGLSPCLDLEVRQLSAGQKRRVGLMRSLSSVAPVWLLDEPFTNLDAAGRSLVETLLSRHLAGEGVAIVAAHDDCRIESSRVDTLVLGGAGA